MALTAFLVVKLVFAQADMHPLFFAYVGMAIALIQRVRREAELRLANLQSAPPPRQSARRSRIRRPDWDEQEPEAVETPDEPYRLPPRRPGLA